MFFRSSAIAIPAQRPLQSFGVDSKYYKFPATRNAYRCVIYNIVTPLIDRYGLFFLVIISKIKVDIEYYPDEEGFLFKQHIMNTVYATKFEYGKTVRKKQPMGPAELVFVSVNILLATVNISII